MSSCLKKLLYLSHTTGCFRPSICFKMGLPNEEE
jgi:hypothetical protein